MKSTTEADQIKGISFKLKDNLLKIREEIANVFKTISFVLLCYKIKITYLAQLLHLKLH